MNSTKKPRRVPGLFLISITIIAGWREPIGNFLRMQIAASLLGIRVFCRRMGLDRKTGSSLYGADAGPRANNQYRDLSTSGQTVKPFVPSVEMTCFGVGL